MADTTQKDIESIIALLDSMNETGTSRIKVETSEAQQAETVQQKKRFGRCDMGNPWAESGMNGGCQ